MFGFDSFVWLLLPLGIVLGWVLARRRGSQQDVLASRSVHDPAVRLNDPVPSSDAGLTDSAVEAKPAHYDLQLLLGNSYRDRGEVERAIAVHERMIAAAAGESVDGSSLRPADCGRLELARDYLAAGLFDRAERILKELVRRGTMLDAALEMMLSVYEQSRDWHAAIATARRLQPVRGEDLRSLSAHYHCELAEQAVTTGTLEIAAHEARQALDMDSASVRASLLIGDYAEQQGKFDLALKAWHRVPHQDVRFISEALPRLERVCEAAGELAQFVEFMNEADEHYPTAISVTLVQARLLAARGEDVAGYLVGRLTHHPRWSGLLAWLELRCAQSPDQERLASLRDALRRRLADTPGYRCTSCGLTSRLLFWQCPGCKHWGTVIPDVEHA